jgi:hypothetical protein
MTWACTHKIAIVQQWLADVRFGPVIDALRTLSGSACQKSHDKYRAEENRWEHSGEPDWRASTRRNG